MIASRADTHRHKVEFEELKEYLDDDALYTHIKSYLTASRAEILDLAPIALMAGCFGLLMFTIFSKFAADEARAADEEAAAEE